MLFKLQWLTEKLQQELHFFGHRLSSMSPHANNIRTTKTNTKKKKQKKDLLPVMTFR